MALRIQLINDIVGSLIVEKTDPIDINALTQTIRRSGEYDGIVYEIIFDLDFLKEGRLFIKNCYETAGGIDAVVVANLYEYNPNLRKWKLRVSGQLNFNRYDLGEETVTVNIEQTGVIQRVINLMETDVDIETTVSENGSALPTQLTFDILHHSKRILLNFEGESSIPTEDYTVTNISDEIGLEYGTYSVIPFDPISFDEITDSFSVGFITFYGTSFGHDPIPDFKPYRWKMKNAGEYTFNFTKLIFSLVKNVTGIDFDHQIQLILKYGQNGIYTNVDLYTSPIQLDSIPIFVNTQFSVTLDLVVGDEVYIHTKHLTSILPGFPQTYTLKFYSGDDKTTLNITGNTIFQVTAVKSIFLYDAIERCLQFYTNQINCFKSTLLGRTEKGYDTDGEGAMITIKNGNWLRNRNDKKLFSSLKELIDFTNSLYCVGFGFEVIDGQQIFVLEKKEYFYNKNLLAASLGKVYNVKKKAVGKMYYNQIEYGYSDKVNIGQLNAIDEFNTLRRTKIPIVNTPNQLKIATKFVTGGYQIEYQRRLYTSTEDGKYDDNNFGIVVIRDGEGFKTKKDEGYISITGVFDSATGYNYDVSPARCLKNWYKLIASNLIRSFSKICKFSYGEVNYTMTTQKTDEPSALAENGNVDLTNVEPIYDPEEYTLVDVPTTRDIIDSILLNSNGYIQFQDKSGAIMEGFLSMDGGIEYDANSKKADYKLLKVHRP